MSDVAILAWSAILLPLTALMLKVRVAPLRASSAGEPDRDAPTQRTLRIAQLVNIAARHSICHVSCLTRSIVLVRILAWRGVASNLRIGVKTSGGKLLAHAWVECAGSPVNDRPDISSEFAAIQESLDFTYEFTSP